MKRLLLFLTLCATAFGQTIPNSEGIYSLSGTGGGGGGGSGTVTSVSVTTANGVSGSVLNPTTTPAISLTLGDITPSSVTLTANASPSYVAGRLYYDTGSECLTFFNNDSAIGLQIGQEFWMRVRNDTGSTISNGAAVYISGAASGFPQIALANANAAATAPAVGLATESIATNTVGWITTNGVVHGLDTSAFTAGARVYLNTTAGTLTATAPSNPNYQVTIGTVVVSNASTGSIAVATSSGRVAGTLAFTDVAQTFTQTQTFTSPVTTTSITTGSASFTAWAGATTLLTFGGTGASASTFMPSTLDATTSTTGAIRTSGGISAAKALNIGTTGTFGTSITAPSLISTATVTLFSSATPTTTAAQMAFDNNAWATSFGAVQVHNGTANTFLVGTEASDTPTNGQVPTWNTGGTITWETPAGTGTVTTTGTMTTSAIVASNGTTVIKTPSATATIDSSGNISTPGTLTVGNAATTAGAVALTQGTTQSTGTTNITLQAPTAVTSYIRTLPGAVGSTGVVIETVSGSVQTESVVTTLPSGLTIPAPVFSTGATASGSGNFDLSGSSGTFKTQTGAVTLGTTSVALPTGTAPTTGAAGVIAFDTNAWATSFGAIQVFDGTANNYVVAALASDVPTNGQVPTWNTGGTVTWETPSGGGSVANPTATIGLTAVNGSASSAIRSDGAPALSQAIAPTWTGVHTFTPAARSSGVASEFVLTTPADTNQTASTESIGLSKTAATRQWATGALTTQREVVFAAPTYGFVGASTLTTAVNVDIADPIAGTNATLTNKYGLRVNNQQITGTLTANTGTNLIGPLVDSVDGVTPLNNILTTIAAGTAYTLTASNADVAFGTTSPTVTLANAGTYMLVATIQTSLVGATYAAAFQTVSYNFRRTNNTAADLSGSTFLTTLNMVALTTQTIPGPVITINLGKYVTTNTTDVIGLRGVVSATPAAGSVTCSNATITAIRLY